jgi:acetylornithine deacetylase/succinyl-diaminopimelate desuccinylase family protein
LRRLSSDDKARLGLNENSVVVLICSEKSRAYDIPMDVSVSDPVALTQKLVQINSASPALGSIPGPGETAIARYIKAWLEHRDVESHWIEPTPGRPSVVGVVRGTGGGGRSLMFNGHIDTVTLLGYDGDALSGNIAHGKLYGRGSADMKCGVAAALSALERAKSLRLRGDVIFAGVADEEANSIGTEQILAAGWTADAAIVSEPTNLEIVHAHKGFVWLEVDIHGVAAHGSRPDLGVDAIAKAGNFLVELSGHAEHLKQHGKADPHVGRPSVHASLVKGGEEISSYPALCTISLEYRTIPGQSSTSVQEEIEDLLKGIAARDPDFKYDVRTTFKRSPFSIPVDSHLATLAGRHVGKALGHEPVFRGEPFWTDCALLADAGIPCLLWGPKGDGFHAKEEWVDVESIRVVSDTLAAILAEQCS